MFTNRNFTRHPISLQVELFVDGKWQTLVTADVSRKGLFLRMAAPKQKEGQAIQLRVELPSKEVLPLLATVKRVVETALQSPTGPGLGLGLEFFAISAQLRGKWDDFVVGLRQKRATEGFSENSQNLRDQLPPPHVREMMRKMREAGEIVEAPKMAMAPVEAKPVVVEVAPSTREKLAQFAERCARAGSVFLRPKMRCEVGRRIHVVLVHLHRCPKPDHQRWPKPVHTDDLTSGCATAIC